MKRLFHLCALAVVFTVLRFTAAAQNLVLNPSFESVNSGAIQCSWYTTQAQFNSAINNWTCPTGGSSDIFVSSLAPACFCSPNSTNGSAVGPQAPRTGTVMVGGSLWGNGGCSPYREYFQGSLSTPLVAGTQYKIEFYVSLADNSKNGCNNIGLKFSTTPVNVASMCVYAATPDVNYTGTPIVDKVNWTKLEFCYTPTTSGLQYFMIGNFFSNVATATVSVPGTNSGNAYYYIDDVSIQPSTTGTPPTASVASNCSSTTMTLSALPAGSNYTWTPPAGGSILSGANAQNAMVQGGGIYTLTVQNPTACISTPLSTTVLATPAASATSPTITGGGTLTCTAGTLSLSSNTVAGATYSWTGPGIVSGGSTPSVVVNAAGNYVLTLSSGGCSSTATATVLQNTTPPLINLTPATTTISCASPTVQLSASLSPAASSYTWAMPAGGALSSTSVTNPVASGNGVFTITATNPANGCVNTATASLIPGTSTVTLSVAGTSICNGSATTLTVNGNASSYTWTPAASLNASTGTSVIANPSSTTTYTVTGANGGCTGSSFVTVTVVPVPVPLVTPASQLICQGQSASMSVSGGTSYTWSPAASLSSATAVSVTASPGLTTVYSVLAATGSCTASTQATVTVVSNPSITITGNTPVCAGNNTALTAQGVNTYTWSPATGLSTTSGSVVIAGPASNTTYTINGSIGTCTAVAYVTVTVNPLPALTLSPTQTVCAGSSASLTASGASSYTWSPAATLNTASGASVTATPGATTMYTVTGSSAAGCINTATTSVVVNPLPSIAVSPSSPSLCAGGLSNMTASGATNYTWSPATFLNTTTGNNVTSSPSVSITYTVRGELASCISQTVVPLTAVQPPVLSISPSATICSGTSTNLAVTGANFYVWSSMVGLTTTNGGANVQASPPVSSSYTVTGANLSGCTGTISVSVDVIPSPLIAVSAFPAAICEGNSASLSATGASSYTWSPTATLNNISGGAADASPLVTTVYTVAGSNGVSPNICLATQTVEVVVTPSVNLVIPAVNPICIGETTQLQASGAMSYSWSPSAGLSSPNQAVSNVKPSATTVYTVMAANGGLCTSQGTVQIIVHPLPHVYAGADTTVNIDEPVTLRGTGNVPVEFLATGSTPLNCNFCNQITVNPQEKTCYTLRGTSSAGCVAYDEVCVLVTKEWNVYIPNAFTPNGDADNDVFLPVGYGLSQIRLSIFDRWGTQIFAGDENNPGWDGKLKGKVCEQGVYIYQVEIKTMAGNTIKKVGHVTLLGTGTK